MLLVRQLFGDLGAENVLLILLVSLMSMLLVGVSHYYRSIKAVSGIPGLRLLISPLTTLGLILPPLPRPFSTYPGFAFPWNLKHSGLFAKFGADTISLCTPSDPRGILYTCEVPFITRICSFAAREAWPKPIEEYGVLSYFGGNVVVAEGEGWRRQRRVGAPAFSKEMFTRLWVDMRNIVSEMVEQESWEERMAKDGEVAVPHVVDLTLRMALAAIARAGFGMDFSWRTNESFTAVCASMGAPHRWHWWLRVLQVFYTVFDHVVPQSVQNTMKGAWEWLSEIIYRFVDIPAVGAAVAVVLAIGEWVLEEIWAVFRRPTIADWNPRRMEVQEALHLVAKDSVLRLAVPEWAMKLPIQRMRRMRRAFDTLTAELRSMAEDRKRFHLANAPLASKETEASSKGERADLLHNLVKASLFDEGDIENGTSGPKGLSDDEIIGNTFIYFLAGHETTAHSLAWTLALLAAYPEIQDQAFQEIVENWPQPSTSTDGIFQGRFSTPTTIDDYARFPFVLACYSETLRIFPPVQQIPKVAAEDMRIVIEKDNSQPISSDTLNGTAKFDGPMPYSRVGGKGSSIMPAQRELIVKKGTVVFVDPPAVHYNPRYWENPDRFDPERFMRPHCKEAFIPFGVGHRACLGRKFSEVESVSMLVHLLRDYSVHLAPDEYGNIDVERAREKFSDAYVRITLTPVEVPLVFKKRTPIV